MRLALAVAAAGVLAACAVPACAQPPRIQAVRLDSPPKIDGVLDDACWQRPADASEFWYRGNLTRPSEETEAWICYDASCIYVAFWCHDPQPGKIVAQQRKRGGSFGADDRVILHIDPWHSHQNTSYFLANPRGTQKEMLAGAGGTKIEWLGDWQAAARTDESGWTAEMAIPWKILKYTKGQDTMGLFFGRYHSRSDQEWYWPKIGLWKPNLMADWVGLHPPAPKLQTIALQYSNFGLGTAGFRTGMDIKRQLSQQSNALLTINPDFGNVEQAVESADFTYTPRVLDDNRPFFSEGEVHDDDEYTMFYSRNIEEVDVGAKFAGQNASQDFSGLLATNGSEERHAFYKSRWDFGSWNRIGFAGTWTSKPGVENNVGSIYCRLGRRTDHYRDYIQYKLKRSFTRGPGGEGAITVFSTGRAATRRRLGWELWHSDIEPSYLASDGILPDPDRTGWGGSLRYGDEYDKGRIRGWSIESNAYDLNLHSGDLLRRVADLSAEAWTLKSYLGMDLQQSTRREASPADDGSFVFYHDRLCSLWYGWNQQDSYRRGSIGTSFGRRAGGTSMYVRVRQRMKLASAFSLDISQEFLRLTGPLARNEQQSIVGVNYDLSNERSLSARLLARERKTNLTFGYRQAVRNGTDVYILFGDPNAEGTVSRVILKLIRPLH